MVMSGGPRRPLSFAGAILLPDSHSSATTQPSAHAGAPSRPRASGSSVRPTAPASPPSARPSSEPTPVAALAPAPVRNTGGAPSSSVARPAPAGAPTSSGRADPPATSVPATPVSSSGSTLIAQALFDALNAARTQAGLAPLTWSADLRRSAASHNNAMAAANQLAPRIAAEPALGVRQANQGVLADLAAENLGSTQTLSRAGALAVQQAMLSEQSPEDGNRQNLMSGSFSAVGIDVLLDPAHGRLWITEDFAQLSGSAAR